MTSGTTSPSRLSRPSLQFAIRDLEFMDVLCLLTHTPQEIPAKIYPRKKQEFPKDVQTASSVPWAWDWRSPRSPGGPEALPIVSRQLAVGNAVRSQGAHLVEQGSRRGVRLGRHNLRQRKTTVITIETQRTVVIRKRGGSAVAWCGACRGNVQMITPADAAIRAAVTTRTIYRRVEFGTLHFIETGDGFLLICSNSLLEPAGTGTTS